MGRGPGEAGPAFESRPHPQPQRPPDVRESHPSARQIPDPPLDVRTRPWRYCRHCSSSASQPHTWRGAEVRHPQTPQPSPLGA